MRKVPKLRFKEFNDEWEEKKLGEVSKLIDGDRGKNYPNEKDILESGILFLSTSNFYNNKLVLNQSNKYISQEKFNLLTKGKVTNQDLIITLRGSIGNIVIFENNKFDTAFINAQMMIIRPYSSNKYYLYYLIQTLKNQKEIENMSSGSAQPQLTKKDLKSFKLYFSSLKEQEKIANFLSSIDKKISLTEEKLESFIEYERGVMQKIFSQELRFKDSEGNDYPEWEEKRLGEISEISAGGDINKKNFSEKQNEEFIYPVYANTLEKKGLYGYSNIYKISGESITVTARGNIGVANYRKENYFPIVRLLVIKMNEIKYSLKYFTYFINTIKIIKEVTGVPQLTAPQLREYKVFFPTSLEEQQKIADFLSSIDTKIENIEKELEELKKFKKGLLQQMFV